MNTKAIIKQAAFDLFLQRKFKEITVQDIIERAGCSRYSFYRYYHDKYELMRLYYTSYVTNMMMEEYDGNNYPDIQAKIFRFVADNESFFENVTEINGTESFWNFLSLYATDFFGNVFCLNTGHSIQSKEEKYEMQYVVNGAISIFKKYLDDKTSRMSPEEISRFLCEKYPKEYYILSEDKVGAFKESFMLYFKKTSKQKA